MINFTGLTKKRVVNLGNRRAPSTSYLEQTRKQRQQREEQRAREKSALVIQSHIRRQLSLQRAGSQLEAEFNANDPIHDYNLWVVKFIFIARWVFPYQQGTINATLATLDTHIRLAPLDPGVADRLLRSLAGLMGHPRVPSIIDFVLRSPGITTATYDVLLDSASEEGIAFAIALRASLAAVVRFMCRVDASENKAHLEMVRPKFLDEDLPKLSSDDKVRLLVSLLKIHGGAAFTKEDYLMFGRVLASVDFSVTDDDESHGVRIASVAPLEVLYSSAFIRQGFQYFTNTNDQRLSQAALGAIATLVYLVPRMKSKLCMLITITPGSYRWFHAQLSQDPIYRCILDCREDYVSGAEWNTVNSASPFWDTLFTFEELYSYWLIVSNDLETFDDEKLPVVQAREFVAFLRTFCLTLVFNNSFGHDKLKEISLSLLHQLYMKNLRLKFLPEGYWTLRNVSFNPELMLGAIQAEEELRISHDSDEEGPSSASTSTFSDVLARMEVLKKLPFFIPFKDRVKIFQSLIAFDRQRHDVDHTSFSFFQELPPSRLAANIRRERILEDAFDNFHRVGASFKNQLSVTFFNEYGGQEAGIDGGGITKEFLTGVVTEGFTTKGLELFKESSNNQLYPNDDIYKRLSRGIDSEGQRQRLLYFRFLGLIVGKCLYENVLIDVSFAPFFLSKWCNASNTMKNSINDLNFLDEELFHNLMKLVQMSPEEVRALELTFTIEEQLDGKNVSFDLLPPHGATTPVDAHNRLNYIHQVSNFKLNQSLHLQTKYFLEGLFAMVDGAWLSMFDAFELQMLISGGELDVNIQDWKENVEYGGYFDDDITIVQFWEVLAEMTPQERFKLLKFVTLVSRAPLLGFGALSPKFGIRNLGRLTDRLPTASTCVNLLKLPDYQDKELIRSKLLYAINTDAHFDLS